MSAATRRKDSSLNEQHRIGTRTMILLGMGNFGMWFVMLFNEATMSLFLEKFAVSKVMTGFVLGLPGVAVCAIPPIVGYISDRARGRFGRRKPFIFAGALATFICWLALPQATAYAHVVFFAASIHFSVALANTPYLALIGDVAPPSQRGAASGYMQFLGSIGGIAYVLIVSRIWDNHPDATMYLVGAVFAASMLATATFVKEPEAPPLEPPKRTGLLEYLKTVTRETEMMKLLLVQMCSIGGFLVIYPLLTLFAVKGLGVSESNSPFVLMVNSVSIMIFVLPLGMLGDRIDRKLLMSILYALCAVFHFLFFFVQDFTQILVVSAIAGIPLAGVIGVGYAFLLDLIPDDRTAEFVGFFSIAAGIPLFLGPLLGGMLIDTVGYRALFIAGPLLMVLSLIIFQYVQPPQRQSGPSADYAD